MTCWGGKKYESKHEIIEASIIGVCKLVLCCARTIERKWIDKEMKNKFKGWMVSIDLHGVEVLRCQR